MEVFLKKQSMHLNTKTRFTSQKKGKKSLHKFLDGSCIFSVVCVDIEEGKKMEGKEGEFDTLLPAIEVFFSFIL